MDDHLTAERSSPTQNGTPTCPGCRSDPAESKRSRSGSLLPLAISEDSLTGEKIQQLRVVRSRPGAGYQFDTALTVTVAIRLSVNRAVGADDGDGAQTNERR